MQKQNSHHRKLTGMTAAFMLLGAALPAAAQTAPSAKVGAETETAVTVKTPLSDIGAETTSLLKTQVTTPQVKTPQVKTPSSNIESKTAFDIDGHDMFRSADANADKTLDREEFVTFALMQASAGDTYFSMIREKGAYETAFNTHDADANARLDVKELGARLEPMTAEKGAIKLPSFEKATTGEASIEKSPLAKPKLAKIEAEKETKVKSKIMSPIKAKAETALKSKTAHESKTLIEKQSDIKLETKGEASASVDAEAKTEAKQNTDAPE